MVLKSPRANHTNSISCILGEIIREQEMLYAGSYDGTISVWEIGQKSATGQETQGN